MTTDLSMTDLRRAVENRGGRIVDESGRDTVLQIEPPDGFLWDGELSSFVCTWRGGLNRPTWPTEKQDALADAIQRVIKAGLSAE